MLWVLFCVLIPTAVKIYTDNSKEAKKPAIFEGNIQGQHISRNTDGIYYASSTVLIHPGWQLDIYDYLASDLYNNIALKSVWHKHTQNGRRFSFTAHHARQQEHGEAYLDAIDASATELTFQYKNGSLAFNTGLTKIAGQSNFQTQGMGAYFLNTPFNLIG